MAIFPDWLHDSYILKGPGNPLASGPVEGIPALHCGLRVIADAFASLRCEVATRSQQVVDHWVSDCLNYRPNDYHTPAAIKRTICNSLQLNGEAFCRLDLNKRQVHYLPYYSVEVKDEDYFNFTYTVRMTEQRELNLSQHEVLHFVLNPDSGGRRGRGIITKCRTALQSAAQQQSYALNIWKNLIRPFVILKTKGALKPEAKKNWKDYFNKQKAGADNAGGGLLLEQGLDAEFINISPADAELLASQRFSVEEIARLLVIPPPFLQELSKMSWATLTELLSVFATQTIQPICQSVEEECELKCFGSAEPLQLKFKLSDLTRASLDKQATAVSQLKAAGIITDNEGRDRLELPPMNTPDADQLKQPLNIQQGDTGGDPEQSK